MSAAQYGSLAARSARECARIVLDASTVSPRASAAINAVMDELRNAVRANGSIGTGECHPAKVLRLIYDTHPPMNPAEHYASRAMAWAVHALSMTLRAATERDATMIAALASASDMEVSRAKADLLMASAYLVRTATV